MPSLDILVGSASCRFVVLDRPAGINAISEADAVLRSHATKRLGMKEGEWSFVIDHQRRTQIIGCAIRKATLNLLGDWATSSKHHLRSIRPFVICAYLGLPRRGLRISTNEPRVIVEDDAVSLIDAQAAGVRIDSLRTAPGEGRLAAERLTLGVSQTKPAQGFVLGTQKVGQCRADFLDLLTSTDLS